MLACCDPESKCGTGNDGDDDDDVDVDVDDVDDDFRGDVQDQGVDDNHDSDGVDDAKMMAVSVTKSVFPNCQSELSGHFDLQSEPVQL